LLAPRGQRWALFVVWAGVVDKKLYWRLASSRSLEDLKLLLKLKAANPRFI
jgi:hypothetical protein